MTSIKKTPKRRSKLCLDIDSETIQVIQLKEKKIFLEEITKNVEIIKSNETKNKNQKQKIKSKNNKKNNGLQLRTKLNIDKITLELRQSLLKQSESPETQHYFAIIQSISDEYNVLQMKSQVLMKELFLWNNKKTSIETQFNEELKAIKNGYWCRVCHKRAVPPFQCCREGHYCGFTHFMSDKSHFIYCKAFEDN